MNVSTWSRAAIRAWVLGASVLRVTEGAQERNAAIADEIHLADGRLAFDRAHAACVILPGGLMRGKPFAEVRRQLRRVHVAPVCLKVVPNLMSRSFAHAADGPCYD
jgi:hypothetical protein